jgi:hypothetical protein
MAQSSAYTEAVIKELPPKPITQDLTSPIFSHTPQAQVQNSFMLVVSFRNAMKMLSLHTSFIFITRDSYTLPSTLDRPNAWPQVLGFSFAKHSQ